LVGLDHFFLAKPCPTNLLVETIENAALLTKGSGDKEINADEVKDALCEFVKLLLMRGVIRINVVPASIKQWLPETTLKAFAPVAGEYNEFMKKTDFSNSSSWPSDNTPSSKDTNNWDDYFDGKK